MMKRISALLLVLCMAFGLFGCAGGTEPKDTEQEGADIVDSEYPDLYEYEFVYAQTEAENSMTFLGYDEGTLFADAARARAKEVEANLNCTIRLDEVPEPREQLQMAVASGTGNWSGLQRWAISFSSNMSSSIRAGYLVPMSKVSHIIDYRDEEKWGNRSLLLSFCSGGELYGLFPNYWPEFGFMSTDFLFVFNEDLVNQAGVSDPRAMVEQGTWNRDALQQLTRDLTMVTPENKIYGTAFSKAHFYVMAFSASGNEYVAKQNGEYVNGLKTNRSIDTFTWADRFVLNNLDYIYASGQQNSSEIYELLCTDRASMILMHAWYIFSNNSRIAYEVENQGLLPFPLADDDTSGNWVGTYSEMQYSIHIPITSPDYEASAHVINALYEPFPGYETEEQRKDYYIRNVFHDAQDCDIVLGLLDNLRYTYYRLMEPGAGYYGVMDLIVELSEGKQPPVATIQSYENTFSSRYYPLIVDMLETAETVFGE